MPTANDFIWMQRALELAKRAAAAGEVPVGAVVVADNHVIGEGWNRPISSSDPSAHAEINAIRSACINVGNYRIPNTTLYVTIEPCTMCFGAMVHARIERIVYGAKEPKAGVLISNNGLQQADFFNHRIRVEGGVLEEPCSQLISDFFALRRKEKSKNKAS